MDWLQFGAMGILAMLLYFGVQGVTKNQDRQQEAANAMIKNLMETNARLVEALIETKANSKALDMVAPLIASAVQLAAPLSREASPTR